MFAGPPDAECPWDFDLSAFVESQARRQEETIRGVTSSSDYPGAAAAALLAGRLGLPGPRPESVLRAAHKFLSRIAQRDTIPEATPDFRLVDPTAAADPLPLPYFLKPVKGSFSILARRIDRPGELAAFLARPSVREFLTYYVHIFAQLLARYPDLGVGADRFLAEELLSGDQVTVEGFMAGGDPVILGVVDSVLHPRTGSFVRFDYPSGLPEDVQARMVEIAERVARGLRLDGSFFNVEMVYHPASGRISILEINPRLCGQFADLYLKVDGASSYQALLDLARGSIPKPPRRRGRFGAAASFPLRVFRSARVEHAPAPEAITGIEARFPGTLIWLECATGDALEDFENQDDGSSFRYGVVNLGAEDLPGVLARFREVKKSLGLRLTPTRSPLRARSGRGRSPASLADRP